MSENALALITGVRAGLRLAADRALTEHRARRPRSRLSPPPPPVVSAGGHCDRLPALQGRQRVLLLTRVRRRRAAVTRARSPTPLFSCRRCDGAGKMTCSKCRGYGYLKKGPDDT